MAFRPIPYGISPRRGIGREFVRVLRQISAHLKKIGRQRDDDEERVHDLRLQIKLLRALLWFARPSLPPTTAAYAKIKLRQAARLLSPRRDLTAAEATLDGLADEAAKDPVREAIRRAKLLLPAPGAEKSSVPPASEARAVALIQKAVRHLVASAPVDNVWKSPGKRLGKAWAATDRARDAARADPTPFRLHEWRKKAKRLLYLLQLLEPRPKGKARRLTAAVDKLQNQLGRHHDLVMLQEHLAGKSGFEPLLELMDGRQRRLRKKAGKTARKL